MTKYILIAGTDDENLSWSVIEGEAQTEVGFLENEVNDVILNKDNWIVFEVVRGTHKDEYIHSGEIDHLLEE